MSRRIRPVALGVLRRGHELLVFDAVDSVTGERFHRPLGGGIEFGERASDAVVRELFEETGRRVVVRRLLGVLENVFTHEGSDHHEICFVFDVEFENPDAYAQARFDVVEVIRGEEVRLPAIWVVPSDLEAPLYPDGLTELLTESAA